jgi:hypothetical protein
MKRHAIMLALMSFLLVLASCGNPFGPLFDGKPYALARINGDPVPWTSPLGGTIIEGSIKLDNDSIAERHEGFGGASWTYGGKFTLKMGRLIIDYGPGWQLGSLGPMHRVDTLYLSGNGLVLRETGFIPPLDSVVRYYARP